jgi:hypothetical protein
MNEHVIMHFDGRAWGPAQKHRSDGPPFERVRELLQGRWTRSTGHIARDGAAAFWNAANGRRVLVMTAAAAQQVAHGA